MKYGIIDISDDLVRGTVNRITDGVSSAQFSIQNPRRKYDGVFTPMDRIIVMMKRVTWLRVFTGYLNSVPLFSVWPRVVNLTASCSLKRLQYWWWDPSLPGSENLVRTAMLNAGNANQRAADGGLKNAVLTLLDRVCNWPQQYAHIAEIPDQWFTWSQGILQQSMGAVNAAREAIAAAQGLVGSNGSLGGVSINGTATGSLKEGAYAGLQVDASMAQNAEVIFNLMAAENASDFDLRAMLTFALANTSLRNDDPNLGAGQVGIYALTDVYGTTDTRHDISTATDTLYARMKALPNYQKMSITQLARSLFPWLNVGGRASQQIFAAYTDMFATADALLAPMRKQAQGTVSNSTAAQAPGTKAAAGAGGAQGSTKVSANTFVQKGIDYVHRPDKCAYTEQYGDTHPEVITSPNPPGLDCSSFVQWCYFQATGQIIDQRVVADQIAWCKQANTFTAGKVKDGLNTRGALMFNSADHVAISIGDGQHVVQYGGTDNGGAANNVIVDTEFTDWGLAPGLDYNGTYTPNPTATSSGTDQTAANPKIKLIAPPDVPPNATDPIDAMFKGWEWAIYDDGSMEEAVGLTGVLALMNDQSILPYIQNLTNGAMRSFSSAPNGDFMAWFPDYYGIWGTAAVMQIETIELVDFTVDWADDQLITHEFVTPIVNNQFGLASGTLSATNAYPELESIPVTIENPAVMSALFGQEQNDQQTAQFVNYVLNRFGARPQWDQPPGLTGPKGAFFTALFYFMRNWAMQYNANVPITFMPELWPGMLMQLPDFNFQAYVASVTHTFDFSEGSGFQTVANIAAPARLSQGSDLLMGMPLAGQISRKRASQSSDATAIPTATAARSSSGKR